MQWLPWTAAFFVAAIALIIHWRQRRKAESQLHAVARWSAELLKTGRLPPTGPIQNAALSEAASNLSHLASQMDAGRRELTAEAASLQSILTGMAEGVMLIDNRHVIRRANPAFHRMLDLKVDPIGQTVLRALRDVSFEEIVTASLKTGGMQTAEVSLTQARPPRHLAVTATPIQEVSGEKAVLLMCHDVTRLRQLEDVRREFVANVSHELRTPLAVFQGYVETLLDNPDMPRAELVGTLEILKRHSTRLNALLEDLLVLARLESRVERLQIEPLSPGRLIENVITDWRSAAEKKQITLIADSPPDAPTFEADAFRMEQVLNNLVDNAIKHTESGGSITVRVAPADQGVEFRVDDTGIGIAPEALPHIFERFYTADKARRRQQGGTGLGLSIVKHIVQLHGGKVRAESTAGKGTSIILWMPLTATASLVESSQN